MQNAGEKIELIPGFKGEVEAFPSELRQVFTNVIKNAVEATADGGNIKIYSEEAARFVGGPWFRPQLYQKLLQNPNAPKWSA